VNVDNLQTELKRAQSLWQNGRAREAAALYQALSEQAPRMVGVWAGLGMAMHDLGDLEAAESAFLRTTQLKPQLGSAHVVLGNVRRQLGKLGAAAESLKAALSVDPRNTSAHSNLGLVLMDQGLLTEALASLGQAVKLDPSNIQAVVALASLCRAKPGDQAFATLEALSRSERISRNDHANIHYSLGKMFADIGDYVESLSHFRRANQLQSIEDLFLNRSFSAEAHIAKIDSVIAQPTALPDDAAGPVRPVFILGLPRSGKTLLEKHLACHASCTDLRESQYLFDRLRADKLMPKDEPDPAELRTWGRTVLGELQKLHGRGTLLFTLPETIEIVPVLASAVPGARFIFMDRDLRDLGLSCYFKNLRVSHNYSNHPESLGLVHRQTRRLVEHFRRVLAPAWLELSYEDLVGDAEAVIRRALDFLDLDFDDACLPVESAAFDITDVGPARTMYVKSPLSKGFVGLWRNYPAMAAQLMVEAGESTEAVDLCRTLLADDPDNAALQSALGLALGVQGDTAGGLDAARSALAASDDPTDALITRARILAAAGDHAAAVEDFWQALSRRPYGLEMPRTHRAMLKSLETVDPELAGLHRDVLQLFGESRQDFGDFGMLYQAYEPLRIPGHRPAQERYGIYRLDEVLQENSQVLDIGCNAGFLSLLCAQTVAHVDAFDIEASLVAIGERVRRHLELQNVHFSTCGFHDFKTDRRYDLIFSFAVHHWIGLPMSQYAARLDQLLAPGGVIVFESQGRRSSETVEEGLDEKISCLLDLGMTLLWDGELLDDGMNKRTFAVLRRV
jgi:tetratricopeptide (TPR) repeat protein